MKAKHVKALIGFMLITSALFPTFPTIFAENTSFTFELTNQSDGTVRHILNVGVSPTLNEYYAGLSHRSHTDNDFPKFVTPYSVRPIADALKQIYLDDEDFANSVLSIVHQIPYEETVDQFYPAETLFKQKGDCDMFSLLAASILKAGGLDVTLLHYVNEEHMNIAVHLAQIPLDARQDVYSVTKENVTYYIAECTGENWRVGECPPDLQNASPVVVLLNNAEQIAPGQVSASFKNLESTTLSLSISSIFALEGSLVTINGQLSPLVPNEIVTLYSCALGSEWKVLETIKTEADGTFHYDWQPKDVGEIKLRSSWAGNEKFAGTTSPSKTAFIFPFYLVVPTAIAFAAITSCLVVYAIKKNRRKRQIPEPGFIQEI